MKTKILLISVITLLLQSLSAEETDSGLNIIPQPNKISMTKGRFSLTKDTRIFYQGTEEVKAIAEKLAKLLNKATGFEYTVKSKTNAKSEIIFKLNNNTCNPESYNIIVNTTRIIVSASTSHGLFNGFQTLRQLFPSDIEGGKSDISHYTIPCLVIDDVPHYSYRGLHLDVSRHFFDKGFIKKYIDMMSIYKFNKFHWHLTDDQGWRIQINKYPLLTTISSNRTDCNGSVSGGFYTQEDIKEVVAYAKERYIDVIPEIEMPGHAVAVLAAYPKLSCTGGPFSVETHWGIFNDVYCAGNEEVFDFLQNVLDEIASLFPYKYIHIGGDECKKTRWERCFKCQSRIKQKGLSNEQELQSYFVNRIEKYLLTKNKQIIGWEEILEGDSISKSATIMSWRGVAAGIQAAKRGNYVIMAPKNYCYFDYYQGVASEEPKAIGGFVPLQEVYSFNPTPIELTPSEAKYILGGQANVWTEYTSTTENIEYMVYPRALALIESLWTNIENKNYTLFENRVHNHYTRLHNANINFSKSADKDSTKQKWLNSQSKTNEKSGY